MGVGDGGSSACSGGVLPDYRLFPPGAPWRRRSACMRWEFISGRGHHFCWAESRWGTRRRREMWTLPLVGAMRPVAAYFFHRWTAGIAARAAAVCDSRAGGTPGTSGSGGCADAADVRVYRQEPARIFAAQHRIRTISSFPRMRLLRGYRNSTGGTFTGTLGRPASFTARSSRCLAAWGLRARAESRTICVRAGALMRNCWSARWPGSMLVPISCLLYLAPSAAWATIWLIPAATFTAAPFWDCSRGDPADDAGVNARASVGRVFVLGQHHWA